MSSPETIDDRRLVRAVADGDKDAFRQLYDRHSATLYALALRILVNHDDAQDVLQETFVQAWKSAGTYDEARGKPLGWLITMARSRAIDRVRSRQTRTRLTEAAGQEYPQDNPETPANEAVTSEAHETVRRALGTLLPEQRTLLELAYFGGLTQTEIAEKLGQPLGTVKTRMRTGLLRLREALGSAGGSTP